VIWRPARVELAEAAGLGYLQHVIALHAAVREGRLWARPSFWQLTQTRKARARGQPCHLVVHEDVLVFRSPGGPASPGDSGDRPSSHSRRGVPA
jgi:modification methylase